MRRRMRARRADSGKRTSLTSPSRLATRRVCCRSARDVENRAGIGKAELRVLRQIDRDDRPAFDFRASTCHARFRSIVSAFFSRSAQTLTKPFIRPRVFQGNGGEIHMMKTLAVLATVATVGMT